MSDNLLSLEEHTNEQAEALMRDDWDVEPDLTREDCLEDCIRWSLQVSSTRQISAQSKRMRLRSMWTYYDAYVSKRFGRKIYSA